MSLVLSPSDVESHSSPLMVAGRVVYAEAGTLVLADALEAITAKISAPLPASPGDFLVVELERDGGSLRVVSVRKHIAHPEPRGDGEFARFQAHRRGRLIAARSQALRIIRQYFEEQRFLEAETPTFVPSPGLDPHVHSLAPVVRKDRTDYLITSPEFHMKRLLVGGFPRIYQCARCFRAEELGHAHEPEFTLVEWYRAFATWEDVASDTEEIVARVFAALSPDGSYPEGQVVRPFERITVREAFARFSNVEDPIELAQLDPSRFFEELTEHVEPGLAALGRPVFLTHYPLPLAALARPCPDDPRVAERFELYLGSTELSNGFGELTDAQEQRGRFEAELARRGAEGEPLYPIDERFLSGLIEGMPPSAGNALGLERLVALATRAESIASTLCFSDAER